MRFIRLLPSKQSPIKFVVVGAFGPEISERSDLKNLNDLTKLVRA